MNWTSCFVGGAIYTRLDLRKCGEHSAADSSGSTVRQPSSKIPSDHSHSPMSCSPRRDACVGTGEHTRPTRHWPAAPMTRSTRPKRVKHGGALPWPSAVKVPLRELLARDASAQLREHHPQEGAFGPADKAERGKGVMRFPFGR